MYVTSSFISIINFIFLITISLTLPSQPLLHTLTSTSRPLQLSSSITSIWQTVYHKRTLYVECARDLLPDGSKQAFISLLEFAEDSPMRCDRVVIAFKKDRIDRGIHTYIMHIVATTQLNSPR